MAPIRTLVVAEKFNTALRIAIVLSDGHMQRSRVAGTNVFRFERPEGPYAVVGLRGHIVELDYPEELAGWELEILPKLLDAPPIKRVTESGIVGTLQSIVREFDRVVLATDFDREGELIGLECLELLQKVEQSFEHLESLDRALAMAAEARQEIDLVWGAVLTRFLSITAEQRGRSFLSVGRVQTPTLALLVERDQTIKEFVPTPYWQLAATGVVGEESFELKHAHGVWEDHAEALRTFAKVEGASEGIVQEFAEEETRRRPPVPFSTTLFVAEATRLGLGAANAMRIAEDLAEKFRDSVFAEAAAYVLDQPTFRATRGRTETTDHPPIYPTGVVDPRKLKPDHAKVYELVVRRFLATLAPDAIGRKRTAKVAIRAEPFEAAGQTITDAGWYHVYPYSTPEEVPIPTLTVGATLPVRDVRLVEEQTKPPRRYTQGSLIQEMERLGLGTKSTRHDVLQKLFDRRYVGQRGLEPTGTGIAVTEALKAYAPVITRPEMTHRLEDDMELVAESKKPKEEVLSESREMLREAYALLSKNVEGVRATIRGALDRQRFVGPCAKCGGALRIERSPRGMRWIQCSNNPASCSVSFPLPAAGFVEPAPEFLCAKCGMPRVKIVFRGQRPELFCMNPECEEHHRAFRAGTCPTCGKPLEIRYSFLGKRFVGCSGYPECRTTYPLPQRGKLERSPEPCPVCHAPVVTAIEAGRPPWTLCINPNCPTRAAPEKREKKAKARTIAKPRGRSGSSPVSAARKGVEPKRRSRAVTAGRTRPRRTPAVAPEPVQPEAGPADPVP
ncbi:MAG: DNA topoisomerase [Thermoplasmatales archaeon]|nr:DNA topoisomerase [Thermoplasmatales archaeon]